MLSRGLWSVKANRRNALFVQEDTGIAIVLLSTGLGRSTLNFWGFPCIPITLTWGLVFVGHTPTTLTQDLGPCRAAKCHDEYILVTAPTQ